MRIQKLIQCVIDDAITTARRSPNSRLVSRISLQDVGEDEWTNEVLEEIREECDKFNISLEALPRGIDIESTGLLHLYIDLNVISLTRDQERDLEDARNAYRGGRSRAHDRGSDDRRSPSRRDLRGLALNDVESIWDRDPDYITLNQILQLRCDQEEHTEAFLLMANFKCSADRIDHAATILGLMHTYQFDKWTLCVDTLEDNSLDVYAKLNGITGIHDNRTVNFLDANPNEENVLTILDLLGAISMEKVLQGGMSNLNITNLADGWNDEALKQMITLYRPSSTFAR